MTGATARRRRRGRFAVAATPGGDRPRARATCSARAGPAHSVNRFRCGFETAQPVKAAQRANALEEPGEGLDVADGIVVLTLRPFELVTLRLTAR